MVFVNVGGKVMNYVGVNVEMELELINEKMFNKLMFGFKKMFKYMVVMVLGGVMYVLIYFYGDVGGLISLY